MNGRFHPGMPLAQLAEPFSPLPLGVGGSASALLGQHHQGHDGAEVLEVRQAPEALVEADGLDFPVEAPLQCPHQLHRGLCVGHP